MDNIRQDCRLKHVVVWVGGDQKEAERFSMLNDLPVAVVPADSSDLAAWNIDPRHGCSVVFVENKMAIGGLADVGGQTEIDFRLRLLALGEEALKMKHGHARMWGRVVTRKLAIESSADTNGTTKKFAMPETMK